MGRVDVLPCFLLCASVRIIGRVYLRVWMCIFAFTPVIAFMDSSISSCYLKSQFSIIYISRLCSILWLFLPVCVYYSSSQLTPAVHYTVDGLTYYCDLHLSCQDACYMSLVTPPRAFLISVNYILVICLLKCSFFLRTLTCLTFWRGISFICFLGTCSFFR